MSLPPLRQRDAWAALEAHHAQIAPLHLRDLFADDPARGERLRAPRRRASTSTTRRIASPTRPCGCSIELANESGLTQRRDAMFAGEHINVSEDRAVLHVALRMPKATSLVVDGVDVVAQVHGVLDQMSSFAHRVRSGEWTGFTGKADHATS